MGNVEGNDNLCPTLICLCSLSFQDPSVTQLTNTSQSGLDEFNPFSESSQLVCAMCLCTKHLGGGFSRVEGPLVGAA